EAGPRLERTRGERHVVYAAVHHADRAVQIDAHDAADDGLADRAQTDFRGLLAGVDQAGDEADLRRDRRGESIVAERGRHDGRAVAGDGDLVSIKVGVAKDLSWIGHADTSPCLELGETRGGCDSRGWGVSSSCRPCKNWPWA